MNARQTDIWILTNLHRHHHHPLTILRWIVLWQSHASVSSCKCFSWICISSLRTVLYTFYHLGFPPTSWSHHWSFLWCLNFACPQRNLIVIHAWCIL